MSDARIWRWADPCRPLALVGVEKHIANSGTGSSPANLWPMSSADEKDSRKEAPKPKPSRTEEAQRVIEEYLNDLREIIRKLRRHLNGGSGSDGRPAAGV